MLIAQSSHQTVAVLFGGRSSEHEISLRSAVYVLQSIPEPWRIIPVGIRRDGSFVTLEGTYSAKDFEGCTPDQLASFVGYDSHTLLKGQSRVESLILPLRRAEIEKLPESPVRLLNLESEVFFPVLHGPNGEDGRLQALFEMAEIAYVGCDLRTSVVGIDKEIQKLLALQVGVPVARFESVTEEQWTQNPDAVCERVENLLPYPCFVKPNALGSAVGCGIAKDRGGFKKLVASALKFDDRALVEELVEGTEVEIAFLGTAENPKLTVAAEIAPKEFYSYENKYIAEDGAQIFLPARLSPEKMKELQGLAAKLAKTFRLTGLCRIDFWNRKKDGKFLFNEINTLPGLTSISQFPKLWEHEGVGAQNWVQEVLDIALKTHERRSAKEFGTH